MVGSLQAFGQMLLGLPDPKSPGARRTRRLHAVGWGLAMSATYAISSVLAHYNYLVFHLLVELVTILLAFGIFVLGWNASRVHGDAFVSVLGWLFVSVASLDIVHAMAYRGMNLFVGYDADLPTQLWILARFLQAVGLLIAPVCLGREAKPWAPLPFAAYTILALVLCLLRWFPHCYIEGQGLTLFKVLSEYVVSLILLGAMVHLWRRRTQLDPAVLRTMSWAILLSVACELAFTFYVGVYDLSNLMGHLFKLYAFVLIYRAVVETGFRRPYALLFHELASKERALRQSHDELDLRVQERTARLTDTMNALLRSEADLRHAQTLAHIGNCEIDLESELLSGSDEFWAILGFDGGPQPLDQVMERVAPSEREPLWAALARVAEQGETLHRDVTVVLPDGSQRDVSLLAEPGMDGNQSARRAFGSVQDITESKQVERELMRYREHLEDLVQERTAALERASARLRTAQRLEALGQLAGGLAHWFNNMLTVIGGYSELIAGQLPTDSPLQEDIRVVLKGSAQAATLTSQMLSYGRRQMLMTRVVEPAEIIIALASDLRQTLGPGIELAFELVDQNAQTRVDPGHLREMLLVMMANARDAILELGRADGRVTLATGRRTVAAEDHLDLAPGDYLFISVTDNGNGLAPESLARLFEPFFTTKQRANHVGMGLPAAYGIAKQLGGDIAVESTEGQGATFCIYLPLVYEVLGAPSETSTDS
jgi:PAS domain S-box-containing protein